MIMEPCTSSGLLTVTASATVVTSKPALLWGITVSGGGGIAAYDNASAASGTILQYLSSIASVTNSYMFASPIYCKNGITTQLDAAGVTAIVYYSKI